MERTLDTTSPCWGGATDEGSLVLARFVLGSLQVKAFVKLHSTIWCSPQIFLGILITVSWRQRQLSPVATLLVANQVPETWKKQCNHMLMPVCAILKEPAWNNLKLLSANSCSWN